MAATIFDFTGIIQQLQSAEDKSGQIQDDNQNCNLSEKSPLVTKAPDTAKPSYKTSQTVQFYHRILSLQGFVTDPLNKVTSISHYKY